MSRGLGRWERLLLHHLEQHPTVVPSGRRYIVPADFAANGSEYSAIRRAARSLMDKGLADEACPQLWRGQIQPVDGKCSEIPEVGCSEHLRCPR